jgi:hypothetical protein|nr:MAG TPA: hypothetical protein [Caudoviricetes sp.]
MINEKVITNPRLLNFENMCHENNIDYSFYSELVEFLQTYDERIVINKVNIIYDRNNIIYEPMINYIIRYTMHNIDKNYIMNVDTRLILIKSSYNELDNMDTVDDVMYNGKPLYIYTKYIGNIKDENFIYYNRLWNYNSDIFDKFKFNTVLFNYLKALYDDKLHKSFNISSNKYFDSMIPVSLWEEYDYYESKSMLIKDFGHYDTLINELEKYPEECEFSTKNSYTLIYSKYRLDEDPKGQFAEYISDRIEFVCGLHIFSCDVKTNDGYKKEYVLTNVDNLLEVGKV